MTAGDLFQDSGVVSSGLESGVSAFNVHCQLRHALSTQTCAVPAGNRTPPLGTIPLLHP